MGPKLKRQLTQFPVEFLCIHFERTLTFSRANHSSGWEETFTFSESTNFPVLFRMCTKPPSARQRERERQNQFRWKPHMPPGLHPRFCNCFEIWAVYQSFNCPPRRRLFSLAYQEKHNKHIIFESDFHFSHFHHVHLSWLHVGGRSSESRPLAGWMAGRLVVSLPGKRPTAGSLPLGALN